MKLVRAIHPPGYFRLLAGRSIYQKGAFRLGGKVVGIVQHKQGEDPDFLFLDPQVTVVEITAEQVQSLTNPTRESTETAA